MPRSAIPHTFGTKNRHRAPARNKTAARNGCAAGPASSSLDHLSSGGARATCCRQRQYVNRGRRRRRTVRKAVLTLQRDQDGRVRLHCAVH
eukprot:4052097-Prymnesium_polylepis.1